MCENCQQQSCKPFIGLTIRAKIIGDSETVCLKFWVKLAAVERYRPFTICFRS